MELDKKINPLIHRKIYFRSAQVNLKVCQLGARMGYESKPGAGTRMYFTVSRQGETGVSSFEYKR